MIKAMVICNGWYAGKVSDLDMLALYPVRVVVHFGDDALWYFLLNHLPY